MDPADRKNIIKHNQPRFFQEQRQSQARSLSQPSKEYFTAAQRVVVGAAHLRYGSRMAWGCRPGSVDPLRSLRSAGLPGGAGRD